MSIKSSPKHCVDDMSEELQSSDILNHLISVSSFVTRINIMENFTQIPNEIICSSLLSNDEKIVYQILARYNPSFPSRKLICKQANIGIRYLDRIIKKLIKLKLINKIKRTGNSNIYEVNKTNFHSLQVVSPENTGVVSPQDTGVVLSHNTNNNTNIIRLSNKIKEEPEQEQKQERLSDNALQHVNVLPAYKPIEKEYYIYYNLFISSFNLINKFDKNEEIFKKDKLEKMRILEMLFILYNVTESYFNLNNKENINNLYNFTISSFYSLKKIKYKEEGFWNDFIKEHKLSTEHLSKRGWVYRASVA